MKIAIIDMDDLKNPFWAAGQARATKEVGKRLALKHEVVVYCSKYPNYKDYEEEGMRYIHIGLGTKISKINNIAFVLSIPFLVSKLKADIIVENFNAPVSVSFAPLFTKIPVVGLPTMFAAEEFSKKYHLPFHWIERFGSRFYKYFLPYSRFDLEKMRKFNPQVMSKIVPQGVGQEYFNIKSKKPEYILFLSRLDVGQKGIDLLIKAYAMVANKINYPLVIAGHGRDEEQIRDLVRDFKLGDKVKMVGSAYGEKKYELLSKALYVAFPSRHDEFPVFTLEALASGLPLVSFDIQGLKWISERESMKATPFDIEEYSNLLLKATQADIIEPLIKNARSLAKRYTWERVASDFEKFFDKVIENESKTGFGSKIIKTKVSKIIEIPKVTDEAYLAFAESNRHIPFNIKRFYYIYDVNDYAIRGKHAHRKTRQVLFCISGKIKVILDNGTEKEEIILDNPNRGIFLDKMVWHEMVEFKKNTILLVLASEYYKDEDYIRDYDKFISLASARNVFNLKNLIRTQVRVPEILDKNALEVNK